MPHLFSRMDDLNWVTPSISDILDQGAAPPGGDGSIREQMLLLQRKLGELDTPARVINVRPTPSYTMFITRPDVVNWQGDRRAVTINEIKRSIGQIADEKKEWKLGFLPQLQEVADTVGILLRTDSHQQLSLRRLLVRTTYRNHPSTLAFVVGNTLEQQLIIHDLAEIGNLIIVGKPEHRQHFLHNILLTLINLNTPGEVRIAIAGESSRTSRKLVNTPHALGRLLTHREDALRLLDGLTKELKRRQQWFEAENVENLEDYNAHLKEKGKTTLPRIIVVVDALSDWTDDQDEWLPYIQEIVLNAGKVGIHTILTTSQIQNDLVPDSLARCIPVSIITRSAATDYTAQLDNFHGSLVRFVDAFVMENNGEITPVESCTISQDEIDKTIAYWNQAAKQREQETLATKVSGKTGVTGVLPAVPRADENYTEEVASVPPEKQPIEATMTVETTPISPPSTTEEEVPEIEYALQQAQALAAYLGWIGMGPLQDVLGMTANEAKRTIKQLRDMKVIENGNSPTPRFIRYMLPPSE